jgi:hypothetical protein
MRYKLLFIEILMQRLPLAMSWIPHDSGGFPFHHRLIVEVVGGFIPVAVLIMEVRGDYLLPRGGYAMSGGSSVILRASTSPSCCPAL